MNAAVRRLHDGERGTTMIELVVGMAIMTIFMGMFTTAMFLMAKTLNKAQAVSTSTSQLSTAFLNLDRRVRYATGVSSPAYSTALPGWHVEFSSVQLDRTTSPATQTTVCTQLRTYQNQLWQRSWNVDISNLAVRGTGTDWKPIASSLAAVTTTQTGGTPPFALAVAAGSGLQQLTVSLTVTSTGTGSATSASANTFTALNAKSTTGPIDPGSVCQQVAVEAVKP